MIHQIISSPTVLSLNPNPMWAAVGKVWKSPSPEGGRKGSGGKNAGAGCTPAGTGAQNPGGGALNFFFGLRAMCHQKDPRDGFFSLAFTERAPFLPTFTQWPQLFFENFDIFDEMLKIFGTFLALKAPILGMRFHWKTLHLCALCHSKDPLFWVQFVTGKDPYIWGAWWHSYVTFICECPPGPIQWPDLQRLPTLKCVG